jgi:hypothetical protein
MDPGGLFKRFRSLGRGSEIRIRDSDRPFLAAISRELGNAELYARVAKELPRDLTFDVVLEHFAFLTSADARRPEVLDFLATHFADIPDGLFDQFSVADLSEILSRPQLRIDGEDSLYRRLAATFSRKPDFFCLLEFVRFEFLSAASLADFVAVSANFLSALNLSLWSRVSRRLLVPVSEPDVEISGPAFGLIAHLTKQHNGNVHDLGIVVATHSASNGAARAGSNATRLGCPDKYFQSPDAPDQWVCYDFGQTTIVVTGYEIASYPGRAGTQHPRAWALEVSRDGKAWEEIDRREGNDQLNGSGRVANFSVSKRRRARFVRLRQIDRNHGGLRYFSIGSFEVFGAFHDANSMVGAH